MLSLLLSAALNVGQTYTLDPNGNGADFTDLQAAADSVPDGSTLVFLAPFPPAVVTTDKSLTLQGGTFGEASVSVPWVLEIYSGSDDSIHLVDCIVTGARADQQAQFVQSGLHVVAGTVVVDQCMITTQGHELDANETGGGTPTSLMAGDVVVIRNSTILGATPDDVWMDSCDSSTVKGEPGGTALDSSAASLCIVVDSTITGGAGGGAEYSCVCINGTLNDVDPQSLVGGDGGPGIVGDAYVSASTITGGSAGSSWTSGCTDSAGDDGHPGVDVIGTRSDLLDRLTISNLVIGDAYTIDASGFFPNGIAFMIAAGEPSGPSSSRKLGFWFVGAAWLILPMPTDANGEVHIQGTVPFDGSLVGVSICMQFSDGGPLTEPETCVVRFK